MRYVCFLRNSGHFKTTSPLPFLTDGVDKVGDEAGGALKLRFCRSFARRPHWGATRSLTLLTLCATHAHTTHAAWTFGGRRQTWPASVLRFCTMAARWKLVACAGEAAQMHSREAVMGLQM